MRLTFQTFWSLQSVQSPCQCTRLMWKEASVLRIWSARDSEMLSQLNTRTCSWEFILRGPRMHKSWISGWWRLWRGGRSTRTGSCSKKVLLCLLLVPSDHWRFPSVFESSHMLPIFCLFVFCCCLFWFVLFCFGHGNHILINHLDFLSDVGWTSSITVLVFTRPNSIISVTSSHNFVHTELCCTLF